MSELAAVEDAMLDQCKKVATHRFSTTDEIRIAVQCAFDLGLCRGKLQGALELRDQLFPKPVIEKANPA